MANPVKIGDVSSFDLSFSGVEFKDAKGARRHQEADAALKCREERSWLNPLRERFDVSFSQKNLVLKISTNTWARPLLWNEGMIALAYDKADERWTIRATKPDGTEWKFCSPDAVIDTVIAGLRCFASSATAKKNGVAESAGVIADSLEANRKGIIASAALYAEGSDCVEDPKPPVVECESCPPNPPPMGGI